MWSQTSWSATNEACFRESSASCDAAFMRMAYRCPHLPQTTVSIGVSLGTTSAVPRTRLVRLGLTNPVHEPYVGHHGHCRHDRCHVRRLRHQTRCGELAALLHSR